MKKKSMALLLAGILGLSCLVACDEDTKSGFENWPVGDEAVDEQISKQAGEQVDEATWREAFANLDYNNCTMCVGASSSWTGPVESESWQYFRDKKGKQVTKTTKDSRYSYITEIEGIVYTCDYEEGKGWSWFVVDKEGVPLTWEEYHSEKTIEVEEVVATEINNYTLYTYQKNSGKYIFSSLVDGDAFDKEIVIKNGKLYSAKITRKISAGIVKAKFILEVIFETPEDFSFPIEFEKPAEDSVSASEE